ncbi:MAG: protelomerase family protein [Crocosphaera sp.]|nr:protelomerase family protein [Crocosphaera sp.]
MTTGQVKVHREIHFIKDPEEIIGVGKTLLSSQDYGEVLSGLVVMTGLKCEHLLKKSLIEYKTPYSIKVIERTSSSEKVREIPTLTLADDVIKGFQFIRNTIEINHLDNRGINGNFLPSVIKVCEERFKTLVPLSSSKESRYTYIQRSIYGTIAVHWYCPAEVLPIDYLAYIYGQESILEGKSEIAKENLANNLHYFDYEIGINRKKIDDKRGIKLNKKGVIILDKFNPQPEETTETNLLLLPIKLPEIDSSNLVELLESDEISVLMQALIKATDCSPSQLLCSQIFEMTDKNEESHLYVKQGKKKRELPLTINSDLILRAVSKLRQSPSMQEWLKLSPSEIDAQILAK